MESTQGGDVFRNKFAGKYLPADVKNWSGKEEVRDAFVKKYAGSYINLNTMSTQHDGGDAFRNKYAGNYLPPDVKNWSDQNEVRDAFKDKYASSSVNLNAVDSKQDDGLNAAKSSKSSNDASSQLSDSRSDVS